MDTPRIVIAGGGTGGHIAPALALAEEITSRFGHDSVHLLCSGNELERGMIGNAGFAYSTVPVRRPRRGLRSKATTIVSTALAVPAARRRLKELDADALVCVGGYAGLPGAMAASLMRLPVFALEANAVPGKVTRTVARMARTCYAHMPLTRTLTCRVDVTGNPLRQCFLNPPDGRDAKRALGLDTDTPTLLVIGGSQGAQGVNRAVFDAAPALADLVGRMQVLHLTGRADKERAQHTWRRLGVRHRVAPFTHNTATWFAASDVALTRAGAGTISELLCLGVPLVMVPYPHAADDHQRANANWVASHGAGVVCPQDGLTPDRVRELIDTWLLGDVARARGSEQALRLARPGAVGEIVDGILEEIGLSTNRPDADEGNRAAA